MTKTYSINFRAPETADDLTSYINVHKTIFRAVVASNNRSEFYHAHHIPKRSRHRTNQFRIVWEVSGWPIAEAHKTIARRFELFARSVDSRFPHEAAYGYVRGRGTLENAQVHNGAPLLLRADLRNFFPSISIDRLIKLFLGLGMHSEAANALAKFVTIDDHLPLGLNASPILANLVCVDLDIKIHKLALAYGCKYTRYADDIAISGKRKLPSREELEKIVRAEGFELSNEKFRISKQGQAHYVTGLSISDQNGPHVPRRMKRRLRQELYYCKKYGIGSHLLRIDERTIQSGVNRLDGTVHYVSHIESRLSEALESEWKRLLQRDDFEPSYDSVQTRLVRNVSCYVDESEFELGNKKYLALGLAFTEDDEALVTSTLATLREHTVDAFYAGDKEALLKNGLHFTDSHPDLRTAYIKQLAGLPYRAFVIFGELKSHEKYEELYASMLKTILPKRLIWYDKACMKFVFEENSKIQTKTLKQVVNDVYISLFKKGSRRPIQEPTVQIAKKLEVLCFSVPDYLLAVFSRFAQISEKPEEIRRHQFERLRDKYRVIVNVDIGKEYSRRRPFSP